MPASDTEFTEEDENTEKMDVNSFVFVPGITSITS
jgi:hypothetical protein